MDVTLTNASFGAYLTSALLNGIGLFVRRKAVAWTAFGIILIGALLNLAAMGVRWQAAGRAPLSNMYESLVCFAAGIAILYAVFDLKYRVRLLAFLIALLAVAALGTASLMDRNIRPLMPALKSNWLTIHVLFCFVGYAALAVSFAACVAFLVLRRATTEGRLGGILDAATYRAVGIGFVFLGLGIVTGAVWANETWGGYWSWDPKETWSLVTWLIYAFWLHAKFMLHWDRRRLAWLGLFGFLAVLFTYAGVNYLIAGLHSYAKS
ncbi:MAG: cytochrome c biogenesis protein CcsA [Planctomycetes bacterium]|nr:cytochrome c biogenesis protein CcsA [Planctomycetota bacterium]